MFSILQGHAGFHRDLATGNWREVKAEDYLFAKRFSSKHPEGKPASMPFKFDVIDEVDPQTLVEMLPLMRRLTSDPHIVAIHFRGL